MYYTTLNPKPQTLNPKATTLNPKPLNPKPLLGPFGFRTLGLGLSTSRSCICQGNVFNRHAWDDDDEDDEDSDGDDADDDDDDDVDDMCVCVCVHEEDLVD